jgi:RHS repeat-associated protein
MKNLTLLLLLSLVVGSHASLPENMPQSVYDELVQAVVTDKGYFDSVALEESISQWLLAQPLPDTDAQLVNSGSCTTCEADNQGSDPSFNQPRNVKIKAKQRANGKYPTVLKIKWKRPEALDASLNYEVSHYNVHIAKNGTSYEVYRVDPKYKRNGKLEKKQKIKFKDRDTGDYTVQVQAVYVPIDNNKSASTKTGSGESSSTYSSSFSFKTEKTPTTVGELTAAAKTCINANGHADATLLLDIITPIDCSNQNLQNSDILQLTNLSNLRSLNLTNNQALTDISDLADLVYLEYLVLSNNPSLTLPNFSKFTELKNLYLADMGLTAVPDLSVNDDLETLSLNNNPLVSGFELLPSLIVLEIKGLGQSYCQLNPEPVDSISIDANDLNLADCSGVIGLKFISVNGGNFPNINQNIESFTNGLCGLTINDTNIEKLQGVVPIRYNLSLPNNSKLKLMEPYAYKENSINYMPNILSTGTNENLLCSNKQAVDELLLNPPNPGGGTSYCNIAGGYLNRQTPAGCKVDEINTFNVYSDTNTQRRFITWEKDPSHNYATWGVTGYEIKAFAPNGDLIFSRQVPLDTTKPFLSNDLSPVKYTISACTADKCGYESTVIASEFQQGLSRVTDLNVEWVDLQNNSDAFNFVFNYPSSLPIGITWAYELGVITTSNSVTDSHASNNGSFTEAISDNTIDSDGYLEFQNSMAGSYAEIGLSQNHTTSQNTADIDYKIQLTSTGDIKVWENNNFRWRASSLPGFPTNEFPLWDTSDVFRVAVIDGVVNYQRKNANNEFITFYLSDHQTNNNAPSSPLFVDIAILDQTGVEIANITNISLVSTDPNTQANGGEPTYFEIHSDIRKSNGEYLIQRIEQSSGNTTVGWRSQYFEYGDPDSIIGTNFKVYACNDILKCGKSSEVLLTNPVTSGDLSSPVWLNAFPSGGNSINLNWDVNDISNIDYFEVTEIQPPSINNETPFRSDSINNSSTQYRMFFIDQADAYDQITQKYKTKLTRQARGRYKYKLRSCKRDRVNGDVCSSAPIPWINGNIDYVTIDRSDIQLGSTLITQPTSAGWYETDDPSTTAFGLSWKFPSNQLSYNPDFYRITSTDSNTNSCEHTVFTVSFADKEIDNNENIWTTEVECEDIGTSSSWGIQSCINGLGCSAPTNVEVGNTTQQNPVVNRANNQTNGTVIGGPGDLDPGLWGNNELSGTGWMFFWASELRNATTHTNYHETYDLIGHWYAYIEVNGVWTPAWFEARMKQVIDSGSPKGGYFLGNILYHTKDGETIVEKDVGNIQLNFDEINNQNAEIVLEFDSADGLFAVDDAVGNLGPYTLVEDLYHLDITNFAVGHIDGTGALDFGADNDSDHYSGYWQHFNDSGFADISIMSWINKGFEFSVIATFDSNDLPIWLVASNTCHVGKAGCTRPHGGYFTEFDSGSNGAVSDLNVMAVLNGFNPIKSKPINHDFGSSNNSYVNFHGKFGRCYSGGDDNMRFREGSFWMNLDVNTNTLEYPIASNGSYVRTLTSFGAIDSPEICDGSNSLPLVKTASLHDISFFIQDYDKTVTTCDPNETGECVINFIWYTDDDFPSIKPYYKLENGQYRLLSDLCGSELPTNQYVETDYQCTITTPGTYTFQLHKDKHNSAGTEVIAESVQLEVVECLDSSICELAPEQTLLLAAPEVTITPAISDPSSDTVGNTQGSFRVDESGAATYSIPIMTPKGTGGLAPTFSLEYNSLAGNGVAGIGWNISGLSSISRCLHSIEQDGIGAEVRAIKFTNQDAFCMNGQRLFVSNSESNGEDLAEYKTEIDDFSFIRSLGVSGNGPATFEVKGKDGLIRTYGTASDSFANINSGDGNNTINTWLLASIKDKYNNEIRYIWDNKTNTTPFVGEVLLDKIEWTYADGIVNSQGQKVAKYELDLSYENRPDKSIAYYYGTQAVMHKRLSDVTLNTRISPTSNSLSELRNYMLLYANNDGDSNTLVSPTGLSHLISVSECVGATCLAPVKFEYTQSAIEQGNYTNTHDGIFTRFKYMQNFKYIDINGDGRNEMVFLTAQDPTVGGTGHLRYRFNLAIRQDDLNWECPLSFCLTQNTGFYKFALDLGIAPIPDTNDLRNYESSNYHVVDYNSDGYQDLFARSEATGNWTYYLSNGFVLCKDNSDNGTNAGDCSSYAPVDTGITTNVNSHNSALLDFNGDGLVDLIESNGSNEISYKYHIGNINSGNLSISNTSSQVYIERENLHGFPTVSGCFPGSTDPLWPICAGLDEMEIVSIHHIPSDFNGDGYNDAFLKYSVTTYTPDCIDLNRTSSSDIPPYYSIADEGETIQGDCPIEYFWSAMIFDPNYYKDVEYDFNNEPHFIPYSFIYEFEFFPDDLKDIKIIDINGDNLSDVAFRYNKQWYYKLNDGKDFSNAKIMHIETDSEFLDIKNHTYFVDYDYDGDIDIVYPYTQSGNEVHFKVRKFAHYDPNEPSTAGCEAYKVSVSCDNAITTELLARKTNEDSDEYIHFINDLNGDLAIDHLYFKLTDSQDQATAYGQNPWRAKDKISKITVGQYSNTQTAPVSSTEIYYESAMLTSVYTRSKDSYSLNYGNGSTIFDVTIPQYLVREVKTNSPAENNLDNKAQLLYHYSGLKVQGGGRGSLGFESVTTQDYQHNMSTRTVYHQDFPYIGMPKDTYTYNLSFISNDDFKKYSCGMNDIPTPSGMCNYQACDINQDVSECYINPQSWPIAIRLLGDKAIKLPNNTYDLISHKHNAYNMAITNPNSASIYAYMDKSVEKSWELNSKSFYNRTESTFSFNAEDIIYGNITSSATHVYDVETGGTPLESKTINNTYFNANTTDWIIGRLKDSSIVQGRNTGVNNHSSAHFIYNAKGQLIKESVDGNTPSVDQELITRHVFDSTYGNEILTVTCSNHADLNCDSITDTTSIPVFQVNQEKVLNYKKAIYDSNWHLYVDETKTHFGTTGDATLITTSKVLSRDKFGNPLQVSDIFGNIISNAYGRFGDLQSSSTPTGGHSLTKTRWCDNTITSNTVNYCPTGASRVSITEPTGAPATREFADQLGRIIRTQTQSMDGDWITVDTTYDDANRVSSITQPYFSNGTIYKTSTLYDEANRIISISSPSFCSNGITDCSSLTTTNFTIEDKKLKTTTINPELQTRTEYKDGSGKITKIVDSLGNPIIYTYSNRGDISTITSYKSITNGNVNSNNSITISMFYDEYGRKTSMIDPDKGNWSYNYNARGDLLAQTDGKGQTTSYTYDMNGRKRSEEVTAGNLGLNFFAQWRYDEDNLYGLLTSESETGETDQQIARAYIYDGFGRSTHVLTDIVDEQENTSASYTQETRYDQYGRIFASIDVTGYGLLYQYNAYGYQTKRLEADICSSGSSHCHNFQFDTNNQSSSTHQVYYEALTSDAYGNIISSKHHDNISKITDYDPATGLPWQIRTNNGTVQDQNFKFSKLGNLLERKNLINQTNEVFDYDDLNRLTFTDRFIDNDFGTINYRESNSYDTTGNLLTKNTLNQSYISNLNNAGPHALTTSGDRSYFYDNNGNITHTTGGDTNKAYSYMAYDKAYQITMNGTKFHQTDFRYDNNHSRYYRKDVDNNGDVSIKHTLGNVEKIIKTSGSSYKRYLGDNLVITLDIINNTPETEGFWDYDYLFKNHIGSTDVITDQAGLVKHSMSFNSWGQRQNPGSLNTYVFTNVLTLLQGAIDITDRGYTGHEQLDGLGLIHMNGRIYDPTIGRFIQADPHIQDPYNTQSLNRYTYVLNNPLTLTDPTGYFSFSRFWNKSGRTIAAIVVTVLSSGAASGWFGAVTNLQSFAIVVAGGVASGAIATGTLKGAVKGGLFAAAAYGIGSNLSGIENVAAHMALSGVDSIVSGDKFGHGVISAGFGMLGGYATANVGKSVTNLIAGTLVSAILSGTGSELSGGKFRNGAVSGAMRFAFNAFLHKASMANISSKAKFKKEQPGVDWNLHDEALKPEQWKFGENVSTEKGLFSIAAHGNKNLLYDRYKFISAKDVAGKLKSKGWDGEQDIIVYACNVGGDSSNNFISQLADITGVNVYGPDSFIHFWSTGHWVIAPSSVPRDEAHKLKNGLKDFMVAKPKN